MQRFDTGCRISPPDARDYHVANFLPSPGAILLPPTRSYLPCMQPVRSQGTAPTCVGHALAAGVMGYDEDVSPDARIMTARRILSVWDSYQGARSVQMPPDDGAYPRAALQYAQQTGICLESDWPYNPSSPGEPGPDSGAHRGQNQLKTYSAVECTPEGIKTALYWLGPLLIAIPAYDGLWTVDESFTVHPTGAIEGSHAVAEIGWDDSRQALFCRNSWGSMWGDAGNFWLPYDYPVSEAWSQTPALNDGVPPPPPAEPWWCKWFGWL